MFARSARSELPETRRSEFGTLPAADLSTAGRIDGAKDGSGTESAIHTTKLLIPALRMRSLRVSRCRRSDT